MALKPHEVDAMLFVLEKHFGEPCLPMSVFKDIVGDWAELVEERFASEEDVPPWVLHLNKTREQIKDNMLFEDECVMYLEEPSEQKV
jgi:hypothetical protein